MCECISVYLREQGKAIVSEEGEDSKNAITFVQVSSNKRSKDKVIMHHIWTCYCTFYEVIQVQKQGHYVKITLCNLIGWKYINFGITTVFGLYFLFLRSSVSVFVKLLIFYNIWIYRVYWIWRTGLITSFTSHLVMTSSLNRWSPRTLSSSSTSITSLPSIYHYSLTKSWRKVSKGYVWLNDRPCFMVQTTYNYNNTDR